MNVDVSVAWQIVGGALVAGLIQGISGFAFGLVATSLWAWSIDPQLVVPTVVFGSFLGQMISVHSVRKEIELVRVAPFLIAGVIGVPIGAALLPLLDANSFRMAVGAILIAYCTILLCGVRLPDVSRAGRVGDAMVALVAGVMGGASALSGPPMTLWCAMRGWRKDVQRATYQAFFITTQLMTMLTYLWSGVINTHSAKLFGLVGPPILIASWVGSRWYRRFSETRFTHMLLVVLLFSGLALFGTSLRSMLRSHANHAHLVVNAIDAHQSV